MNNLRTASLGSNFIGSHKKRVYTVNIKENKAKAIKCFLPRTGQQGKGKVISNSSLPLLPAPQILRH